MRVLVGMSGGLDSTCAARIMMEKGDRVEGALLVFSDATDKGDALRASELLGIPLNIIDVREAFSREVIDRFCFEYLRARTPNPCVFCNPTVKFASLCAFARENGFDAVATGHYAGIGYENGRYFVREAADAKKDQSYMLARLSQEQLSLIRFPLESANKEDLRALFPDFDRPESEDICFIESGSAGDFVEARAGKSKIGDFILDGRRVAKHKGIAHYTVGQRKNLGIAAGERVYIEKIDAECGDIRLIREAPKVSEVRIGDLCFQAYDENFSEGELDVRLRYHAKRERAKVKIKDGVAAAAFDSPVGFCAPGQSAVFYDGDKVAFCGTIEE